MKARFAAIILVYLVAGAAWMILGGLMTYRTNNYEDRLHGDVSELWGTMQQQRAPSLIFHWDTFEEQTRSETVDGKARTIRERVKVEHQKEVSASSSDIHVDLRLDQRLRGLLWYSLYDVVFGGRWKYEHEESAQGRLEVIFSFPDASGMYDDFHYVVGGVDRGQKAQPKEGRINTLIDVRPGQKVDVEASYKSRGMDKWEYSPSENVSVLQNFRLVMTTSFRDIDFPTTTVSPSWKKTTEGGWELGWQFQRLVTGRSIGMVMPARIQPGQMASSLSFSAPISLLFFFLLIWVLATLRSLDIHPLNYFFLAGAFFAFHLFFGYSVDFIHLVPAFVVSSLISMALVASYLRLVVSSRFAYVEAALAQLVYLVGFSLAHFWQGFTGLTVSILAILTLFVLMQLTGRIKWSEVMAKKPGQSQANAP